jgi:hypothetical protein
MKKLLLAILFCSIGYGQTPLPNTGVLQWPLGTRPGAGGIGVNSDSLNGNWFKLDSLLGVNHKGGRHFNIDHIGIFRFVTDSTIKIRWWNGDTVATYAGTYSWRTQVRDNGTRSASNTASILVRTSDDDSTLSGMTAQANGVTQIFGNVVIGDSLSLQWDGNDGQLGSMKFHETTSGDAVRLRLWNNGIFTIGTNNDTLLTLNGEATEASRYVKIDPQATLMGGAKLRDTSAFTTTATRLAISIPGATGNDVYAVSVRSADAFTLPGAGEFLSYFAKTDSLIIMRNTGTTSGLKVSYIRVK